MISIEDLKKIERLAKLRYDDNGRGELAGDLNNIIKMIDSLQDIDCSNVEPMRSVIDAHQRLAEDQSEIQEIEGDLFANIPNSGSEFAREVKCFVVPKVVE